MRARNKSLQLSMNKRIDILKAWEDFKAGRVKLRRWTVNKKTGERTLSYAGIEDLRKKGAETRKK